MHRGMPLRPAGTPAPPRGGRHTWLRLSVGVAGAQREARCGNPQTAALTLIWATLEQDRLKWRGVRMDEDILQAVAKAREEVKFQVDLSVLDMYLEAA